MNRSTIDIRKQLNDDDRGLRTARSGHSEVVTPPIGRDPSRLPTIAVLALVVRISVTIGDDDDGEAAGGRIEEWARTLLHPLISYTSSSACSGDRNFGSSNQFTADRDRTTQQR